MSEASNVLKILRMLCTGAFAVALFAAAYGVAVAPTNEPTRLGLRGLKRQKALRDADGWASIEPLVRWLGVRLGRFLSEERREKIDSQLMRAGDFMGLTPEEYMAMSVLGSIVGTLFGFLAAYALDLSPSMLGLIGGMFGASSLYLHLDGVANERLGNISRSLPYAIDLMALSMGAGLDFPGATRQVVEKSSNPADPLVEELTLLLQALSLGRTRKDALQELSRRVPSEAVSEFANAIIQAEERGNPVADVLAIQAAVSRTRRSIRAEESAAKAAAALVLPLMLVFACVLSLLLGPAMISITQSFE